MQQLRERGIYTLPEGGEFVAHAVFRGGYVLYTPVAWDFSAYTPTSLMVRETFT